KLALLFWKSWRRNRIPLPTYSKTELNWRRQQIYLKAEVRDDRRIFCVESTNLIARCSDAALRRCDVTSGESGLCPATPGSLKPSRKSFCAKTSATTNSQGRGIEWASFMSSS